MVVLKRAGVRGDVRSLTVPAMPIDDEASRLRIEHATLVSELAEVRDRAAGAANDARAAVAKARTDGIAEGRRIGIASVERGERERIEVIRQGVADAAEHLSERLVALDGLAAALARACLDRVFARPDTMAAMVVAALEKRLAVLHAETVLTVRVSGADFADDVALAAAVRSADRDTVVAIDAELPSGACRMTVRLGQIDLDLPGQWATIAQALDGMARA